MNYSVILSAVVMSVALSACDRPAVVAVPTVVTVRVRQDLLVPPGQLDRPDQVLQDQRAPRGQHR